MYRSTAAALALILAAAPLAVLAQDVPAVLEDSPAPPPLVQATAELLEHGQVLLEVTFEGSACQQAGEAEVTASGMMLDHVTIPTTRTAETCTLQLVPVEYQGTIAIEPDTQTLEITVLDPDGKPQAVGSIELGEPPSEAPPPPDEIKDRGAEG